VRACDSVCVHVCVLYVSMSCMGVSLVSCISFIGVA